MALISCPECKRIVSSSAENCPHCGFPVKSKVEKMENPDDNDDTEKRKTTRDKIVNVCAIGCTAVVVIGLIAFAVASYTSSYSTSNERSSSASASSYSSSGVSSLSAVPDKKNDDAKTVQTLEECLKDFPDLANISTKALLSIYNDYEKAWDASDDPSREYEDQVTRQIAEKYGITEQQAILAYAFTSQNYSTVVNGASMNMNFKLKNGKFLSANSTGATIVIKAKIQANITNKLTIEQNYYNVCDLIRNQGLDIYNEVQYWAVGDMTDGSESKVISFTVPKNIIELIATKDFADNTLGEYVTDLWILPSLQD